MLENCDKLMHLRFNFDACPMHSPFGFVHLMHQNLSARALFCHNSLAKVNTQLLIYKINDATSQQEVSESVKLLHCTSGKKQTDEKKRTLTSNFPFVTMNDISDLKITENHNSILLPNEPTKHSIRINFCHYHAIFEYILLILSCEFKNTLFLFNFNSYNKSHCWAQAFVHLIQLCIQQQNANAQLISIHQSDTTGAMHMSVYKVVIVDTSC